MWPPRVRFVFGSAVLAFGLAIFATSVPVPLRAESAQQPRASLVDAIPGGSPRSIPAGRALALASGDKDRVPRSKPPPAKKPDSDSQGSSDDGDSDHKTCFDDCISSFFSGLFTHSAPAPAPALEPQPVAAPQPATVPVPETHGWAVHDHGWLLAATRGDSVVLWAGAYEPGRPDVEAGRLPDGTEVSVLEVHELADRVELRVVPVSDIEPVGWVPSPSLTGARPPAPRIPPSAALGGAPAQAEPARSNPSIAPWGVQLVMGGGGVVNEPLVDEYGLGFHLEARYTRALVEGLPLSVGLGLRQVGGTSTFDYVTAREVDEPLRSRLRIVSVDLAAGVRDGRGSTSWFLSLAPALFYVHESADIRTTRIDTTSVAPGVADTVTRVSARVDNLDRLAGGGVLRLGAGWRTPSRLQLDLLFDVYAMAWTGHRDKSLTADFTDKGIYGVDVAFGITFPGR